MTIDEALREKTPQPNGVATNTGIGTVGVYINSKGKTETPLPIGAIVTPNGSTKSWRVTGGTPGNYTSELVTDTPQSNTTQSTSTGKTQSVADMYKKKYNRIAGAQDRMTGIAVNQLESQKKGVNTAFDASARNAYTNYMMNNKNLNEDLIRSGLSQGGMSESAQVASNAAYGNELIQNETGRNQAINDIDSQIADVRYKGEAAKLEAQNDMNQRMIDYYTDKEIREQDRQWKLDDDNRDRDRYLEDVNRERGWDKEDRDSDDRSSAIKKLLEMGGDSIKNPPRYLLDMAGITLEEYLKNFFYK